MPTLRTKTNLCTNSFGTQDGSPFPRGGICDGIRAGHRPLVEDSPRWTYSVIQLLASWAFRRRRRRWGTSKTKCTSAEALESKVEHPVSAEVESLFIVAVVAFGVMRRDLRAIMQSALCPTPRQLGIDGSSFTTCKRPCLHPGGRRRCAIWSRNLQRYHGIILGK